MEECQNTLSKEILMNSIIFWATILHSLEKALHFRGIYHHHLQGRRVRRKKEVSCKHHDPEDEDMFFWNAEFPRNYLVLEPRTPNTSQSPL
jgi:hypothetical protein